MKIIMTFLNAKVNATTDRVEKVDQKKMGSFVFFPCFFSYVIVLKLSKKVDFLLLGTDLSKKPKSVKIIYLYAFQIFPLFQKTT